MPLTTKLPYFANEFDWDDREACACKRVGEAPQQAGQRQRQRTPGRRRWRAATRRRNASATPTTSCTVGLRRPRTHTIHEHHEQVHRLQHGGRAPHWSMDREQVRHLHKRHAGERGDKVHEVVTHGRERFAHRFGEQSPPHAREDQPGEDLRARTPPTWGWRRTAPRILETDPLTPHSTPPTSVQAMPAIMLPCSVSAPHSAAPGSCPPRVPVRASRCSVRAARSSISSTLRCCCVALHSLPHHVVACLPRP